MNHPVVERILAIGPQKDKASLMARIKSLLAIRVFRAFTEPEQAEYNDLVTRLKALENK